MVKTNFFKPFYEVDPVYFIYLNVFSWVFQFRTECIAYFRNSTARTRTNPSTGSRPQKFND
jgi:hypothetical protein